MRGKAALVLHSPAAHIVVKRIGLLCLEPQVDESSLTEVPTLGVVSHQDVWHELSLTGKRGVTMRQYMGYIGQLGTGQTGKPIPDEGETTAAIRRHLGATALHLGKRPVGILQTAKGRMDLFW